jgi:hypothetical protein
MIYGYEYGRLPTHIGTCMGAIRWKSIIIHGIAIQGTLSGAATG